MPSVSRAMRPCRAGRRRRARGRAGIQRARPAAGLRTVTVASGREQDERPLNTGQGAGEVCSSARAPSRSPKSDCSWPPAQATASAACALASPAPRPPIVAEGHRVEASSLGAKCRGFERISRRRQHDDLIGSEGRIPGRPSPDQWGRRSFRLQRCCAPQSQPAGGGSRQSVRRGYTVEDLERLGERRRVWHGGTGGDHCGFVAGHVAD